MFMIHDRFPDFFHNKYGLRQVHMFALSVALQTYYAVFRCLIYLIINKVHMPGLRMRGECVCILTMTNG